MQNIPGIELVSSFLVVAEELNFRRSAERLNLDQSALSRRIQKLEHFLGFKLLERNTREVALTPAGQSFYRDNAAMAESYRASIRTARRVAAGHREDLRIGYMTFAAPRLMPRALARFHARYPYVRLSTTYMRTQAQRLALAKNEIDVGFMIDRFDHSDFQSLTLSDEPLHAILPRGHALAAKESLRPEELADLPLVLGEMQEWDEYRWRLEGLFSAEGLALQPAFEAAHTLAIGGMVGAGLGYTIFPESLTGFLGADVVTRPIDHPKFRSPIALVWRASNPAPELANFIRIAAEPEKPEGEPSPMP